MPDAIFLRLNEKFALGADGLQWILFKSRRKEPSPLDSRLVFGRGGSSVSIWDQCRAAQWRLAVCEQKQAAATP
jgi:hypothetical protein